MQAGHVHIVTVCVSVQSHQIEFLLLEYPYNTCNVSVLYLLHYYLCISAFVPFF